MVDYESDKARYWRACDVWTFSEVLFLLNGEWPTGDRSPPSSLTIVLLECLNEIVYETENIEEDGYLFSQETEVQVLNPVPDDVPLRQIVEAAVAAGRLSPLGAHKSPKHKRDFEDRFLPSEVIAWATSRGCFPAFPFTETHAAIDRLLHPAQTAAPVVADSASNVPACDFSILATREQLIEAFGIFTGMDASWFKNLKDTPALLGARKVVGQGGRGHIAEPWFCPFEVMQWLADSKRRKGRKLSAEKAWELLEKNFPKVHSARSVGDPRASD